MVALITSGSYLGSVIALIVCPQIIVRWGWPAIFYVFGFAGLAYIVVLVPFLIFWRFVTIGVNIYNC